MDQLRMTLEGLPHPPEPPTAEEVFRTSVTALVTFASCPQRFHWSEIDRLPRRPSPGMRAGMELHRRIELYNRGSQTVDLSGWQLSDAVEYHGAIAAGAAA